MKALLLVENDECAEIVRTHLKPLGFEAIRYRNPHKALDNLEEVAPDAVIVSAADYPRHWKIITEVVRSERGRAECVLIVLKGERFSYEEADKAAFLGVNGVVSERLEDMRERSRFELLLKRYVSVEDSRKHERLAPATWDRLAFLFGHPMRHTLVLGRIDNFSAGGLSFSPDYPELTADLKPGTLLKTCTLRVGDTVMDVDCRLVRGGKTLALAFNSMREEENKHIKAYLSSKTLREMKALSGNND